MNQTATMIGVFLLALSTSAVASERGKPTASYEDFLVWGNRIEGRWVGKITLIADWPGLDKKQGDVVVAHVTRQWAVDKRAIKESSFLVNAENTTLHYWDAASKQIKLISVDTAGTTWVGSIGRDGEDKWPWIVEGSLPDGTKMKGSGFDILKNDGTHVVNGTVYSGGQKLPKLHDVFKRVSK